MQIIFLYEEERYKIFSEDVVINWINRAVSEENKKIGEINFQFCSEEKILEINKQFLNHNYLTDIITFDTSLVNIINCDIFISFDTVFTNSQKFKTNFREELYRVIIHGVMHSCGYKDYSEEQKKLMRKKEDHFLSYLEKL